MITFSDIQQAFFFVSSAEYGEHSAVLFKDTGRILYSSEMGGMDDIEEMDDLKDKDLDSENCIAIPHKNDLDLGRALVLEFVGTHMPSDSNEVRQIFRRPGAYRRFKDFLERKKLLERWYEFEKQREEEALRKWCRENEIQLSD